MLGSDNQSALRGGKHRRRIPTIPSSVFEDHGDSRFAIGIAAIGSKIVSGRENEFNGAVQLRVRTYLDKGWVTPESLDEHGTEIDADDGRSVHFVVLERTTVVSAARVVGNMRLIVKGANDSILPIEEHYPEVFAGSAVALPASTEVSRLIGQHEDVNVQRHIKWPLFIAGVQYVQQQKLGTAYGLLEPNLAQALAAQSVPIAPIAEAKYVKAINSVKQPVEIDVPRLSQYIHATGNFGVDLSDGSFSYFDLPSDLPLPGGHPEELNEVLS